MSDKELLEWAAKAIGEQFDGWCLKSAGWHPWNPLADDGAALRLAVRLRLAVDAGGESAHAYLDGPGVVEPYGADRMAATRRAITRAAAEIGKAMQ